MVKLLTSSARINALSYYILFALFFGSLAVSEAHAGCDPCICGLGGGIPPPPECYRAPGTVHADFAQWVQSRNDNEVCRTATGWRRNLCSFAEKTLVHDAWGFEHGLRNYSLSLYLAERGALNFDDDTLFAAALIHDLGGFAPYKKPQVDHALRSSEIAGEVLLNLGFPAEKVSSVSSAVLRHSYYDANTPETTEGRLLKDADALDFLGIVGATRILSVVGREASIPTQAKAMSLLEALKIQASTSFLTGQFAQELGKWRASKLEEFITAAKIELMLK